MRADDCDNVKAVQKRRAAQSQGAQNRDREAHTGNTLSDEGSSGMGVFQQPLKVLMTADSAGGVFSYAVELARALNRKGVAVTLAVMGGELDTGKRTDTIDLSGTEIIESRYRLEWMDDPWDDVESAGGWLLEIQKQARPDIIHLNNFAHGNLPWQGHAPVLVVGHSCVLSWWDAVRKDKLPRAWKYYAVRVQAGLQAADAVAAPSAAMLACLEKHYGPFRRPVAIHNGIDTSRFWPGRKREFILTAGRLGDDSKNLKALASIAAGLPWPVFSAGDPHDAGGAVNYLGRMSRQALAAWFSRASIYALPARYEPFGLTALEAGLSGCALVLGDIPSLREVWGNAALFVDPEDPGKLREAINYLTSDRGLRGEFSRRARERALEYSVEKSAAAYLDLYATLQGDKLPQKITGPAEPGHDRAGKGNRKDDRKNDLKDELTAGGPP